jgi:hypothetical protein
MMATPEPVASRAATASPRRRALHGIAGLLISAGFAHRRTLWLLAVGPIAFGVAGAVGSALLSLSPFVHLAVPATTLIGGTQIAVAAAIARRSE